MNQHKLTINFIYLKLRYCFFFFLKKTPNSLFKLTYFILLFYYFYFFSYCLELQVGFVLTPPRAARQEAGATKYLLCSVALTRAEMPLVSMCGGSRVTFTRLEADGGAGHFHEICTASSVASAVSCERKWGRRSIAAVNSSYALTLTPRVCMWVVCVRTRIYKCILHLSKHILLCHFNNTPSGWIGVIC